MTREPDGWKSATGARDKDWQIGGAREMERKWSAERSRVRHGGLSRLASVQVRLTGNSVPTNARPKGGESGDFF